MVDEKTGPHLQAWAVAMSQTKFPGRPFRISHSSIFKKLRITTVRRAYLVFLGDRDFWSPC